MVAFRSPFLGDRRALALTFLVALLLNGATWAFLRFRIPPTGELIPVHYTIYFGIDRLGSWISLFVLPLSGFVILIINAIGAVAVRKRDPFVGSLLIATALVMQVMVALAAVLLVAVNITP